MILENRLLLDARSIFPDTHPPKETLVSSNAIGGLIRVVEKFSPDFRIDNGSVKWEERDRDFKKLLQVKEIIDLDLDDQEFLAQLPKIKDLLLTTYIFKKLDDKNIEVSKAHTGVTPFEHTVHVLQKLKTTGLTKEMVRAVRWATIWHDIGKIFGATVEFGRFHSQLSTYVSWEFFYKYCEDLGPELIQQMLFAIQFHHSPEGLDHKWLTEEEVENRLQNWTAVALLYAVTSADILSISEYQDFVSKLDYMVERFQPTFFQAIKALGLFRTVLGEPDTKSYEPDGQHAQPTEALA